MPNSRDDFVDFERLKCVAVLQDKNLGDSLLTTPLIKSILANAPNANLLIFCKSHSFEIYKALGPRVSCVDVKLPLLKLMRRLAMVDLTFLTRPSLRFAILMRTLRVPFVSHCLNSNLIKPNWLTPHYYNQRRHIAEKHMDLLRRLGGVVKPSEKSLVLPLVTSDQTPVRSSLLNERYVVVHPGTRWLFKTPQINFWIGVIRVIAESGYQCILTGSADGNEGLFLQEISAKAPCLSFAGKTDYLQLIKTLQDSSGFLGVDTFSSHVAAAAGVPGVVLFGPTIPDLWGPWGLSNRLIVFRDKSRSCLGCSSDGCGGSKVSECLDELIPNEVAETFLAVIH